MDNFKFVLNYAGVGEILKSQEMLDICKGYAEQMVNDLGEGYEVESFVAGTRVVARSTRAHQDNLDHNTLLKEVGKQG